MTVQRRRMRRARLACLGFCAALGAACAPIAIAAEPEPLPAQGTALDVNAVETDGTAIFHLCRDRLMSSECRIYGHVRLPYRIRRGDVFSVSFGSNPKRIIFQVERILSQGAGCDILALTGDGEPDRLTSPRCGILQNEQAN